jgi:hypothetical protein
MADDTQISLWDFDPNERIKQCSRCRKIKPASAFYVRKAGPYQGAFVMPCIECCPDYARERGLLRMYGITVDRFEEILALQDGLCAICRTPAFGAKLPHVDHDHESGSVRGILCSNCNTGLGLFKDDPELLRAAAKYLEGDRDALEDHQRRSVPS